MLVRLAIVNRSVWQIERIRASLGRLEGGRDIPSASYFGCGDLKAESAGRRVNLAYLQHGGGIGGADQDRQPAETRDDLAQEFEALTCGVQEIRSGRYQAAC
jgi:hypothetical protein